MHCDLPAFSGEIPTAYNIALTNNQEAPGVKLKPTTHKRYVVSQNHKYEKRYRKTKRLPLCTKNLLVFTVVQVCHISLILYYYLMLTDNLLKHKSVCKHNTTLIVLCCPYSPAACNLSIKQLLTWRFHQRS